MGPQFQLPATTVALVDLKLICLYPFTEIKSLIIIKKEKGKGCKKCKEKIASAILADATIGSKFRSL